VNAPLSILGVGIRLPRAQSTRDLVARCGGDPSDFKGWDRVCVAEADDHPSSMGAASLERALADAGVDASELGLVLFAGMSRDYPPSWSGAIDVMRLVGAPSTALGLDMTVGCLGSLAALDLARAWLSLHGPGYAAIVASERWSYTIDRSDAESAALWAHGDGAGSLVVGVDVPRTPVAELLGCSFMTASDYNGTVLVKYGGTRFPAAPPGEDPHRRRIKAGIVPRELATMYVRSYAAVFDEVRATFDIEPERLICNQIGTGLVASLPGAARVAHDRVVLTGPETGHLGSADIVVGLRRLLDDGPLDGPILVGASTPYAFGAGVLVPPS
jgi:3-oxoacyl-[acyl-carrier-protein] synthase III